jgi:hypothetical protein
MCATCPAQLFRDMYNGQFILSPNNAYIYQIFQHLMNSWNQESEPFNARRTKRILRMLYEAWFVCSFVFTSYWSGLLDCSNSKSFWTLGKTPWGGDAQCLYLNKIAQQREMRADIIASSEIWTHDHSMCFVTLKVYNFNNIHIINVPYIKIDCIRIY